jgi:hypothetical protein
MKTLAFALLLTFASLCVSGQKLPSPADKKATRETVVLFQSLYDLKNKGIMFGHQDDLIFYNSPRTLFLKEVQEADIYRRK